MGFQLTSRFGKNLAVVKIIALIGGFAYVRIFHFNPSHGSELLFWSVLGVLALASVVLYAFFGGSPERQERQYLLSLAIDMVAIGYLFLLQPQALMAMLVGLAMVNGFYTFVLPRTSGVLVGVLSVAIYGFSVLLATVGATEYRIPGSDTPVAFEFSEAESSAALIVGIAVLSAVVLLTRQIKHSVETAYKTGDELTFELTQQVIEAEVNYEELLDRNREVQTLLQILSQIVAVLDWDELFDNIIKALRLRFKFDKFCIYLYNTENNTLELAVESGGERAAGIATSVKPGQGLVGWCFNRNEGVLSNDVKSDKRYIEFNERGKRIRALACEPLVFRGERLGVLCLDSERGEFMDEQSFSFLGDLTPLVSVAVSNSLKHQMVKTESNTDSLTGLNNHRGFMEKFLPTLEVALKENVPLALLMIDIDDFKVFNDSYGHLVGNLILVELAKILVEFFRSADLIARWGGEEFVVVLNGTPPDIAPRICEQLRRKIESHQFPVSLEKDTFKQVTASLGLSTSMDRELEPELVSGSRRKEEDVYIRNLHEIAQKMVRHADEAMYEAKRQGKNQLMISLDYPKSEPEDTLGV
jgi:diguanylate cyclase (GGDEF)-like protein